MDGSLDSGTCLPTYVRSSEKVSETCTKYMLLYLGEHLSPGNLGIGHCASRGFTLFKVWPVTHYIILL